MNSQNLKSIVLRSIIFLLLLISNINASGDFYAYYTKLPGNFEILEDYQEALFSKYSDLVIYFGEDGQVIFSRNTSYLPVWRTREGEYKFPEKFKRKGDGPAHRPDILSKYSHVRLIQQSVDTIIVHWRYFPEMENVEWDNVVEEYYTFTKDGQVIRTIQKGTPRTDEWKNKKNRIIQRLKLKKDKISFIKESKPKEAQRNTMPVVKHIADRPGEPDLISYFDFEKRGSIDDGFAVDKISAKKYQIMGYTVLRKQSISGQSLQFDGYYSGITLEDFEISETNSQFTVQGWIALRAYPFDWAPLIQQSEWNEKGFYLGVDKNGYPGFHLAVDKKWISLIDSTQIPLFRWHHLAAVYNHSEELVSLYINGENIETRPVVQKIKFSDSPMTIGLNRQKMPAIEGRIRRGKWPSLFGVDGLVDEVKVYDVALSSEKISAEYKKMNQSNLKVSDPSITKRDLPVNPENKTASRFEAVYKTLEYYPTWDNLWRIGEYADIVIDFDLLPTNLVFWRGTSYGPYFVTENGKWIGDQSNEDYRLLEHPGEAEGCLEHMSDKQCRHSHVRIIENTDARIQIHWRYGLVDSRYLFSPRNDGWGSWSDEYWTIYPDGIAIRHLARGKVFGDGWVETMFLSAPGTKPENNTELEAITLINDEGKESILSWEDDSPRGVFENTVITQVNTKSRFRMFNIYPTESSVEVFSGHSRRSPFHWWNHWPVSQITSDGRGARAADRLAHSSLLWGNPNGDFLLYGITDKKPSQLISLAKSWNNPPQLKNIKGFTKSSYVQAERAYHINAASNQISFTIEASEDSPLVNPSFIINNWDAKTVKIEINEKEYSQGKQFRYGNNYDTSGKRYKIIWLDMERSTPVSFIIENK